jgi:glucokinase
MEVGGSHVTCGAVDPVDGRLLPGTRHRAELDPHASAPVLLDILGATARQVAQAGGRLAARWGVAVPGPFDYARGIAAYHDVGKFAALAGVDVGAELAARIGCSPTDLRFLNDASAFGLGAWHRSAAHPPGARARRMVAITLGTGVGSAFLADGVVVEDDPRVPPEGRADLLTIDGRPLEETASTRAIAGRYASLTGVRPSGLRELASRAARDATARDVITSAMRKLGTALAPWLAAFTADVLVVGGAITTAWDLIGPPLLAGLTDRCPALAGLPVTVDPDTEYTALLGAALHACRG